jgi:hypothetical protein
MGQVQGDGGGGGGGGGGSGGHMYITLIISTDFGF